MAKLFIQDTTLTAIADAIREKTSGGSGEPVVVSVHTPNLLSREDTVVGYGNYSNVDLGGELVHDVVTIAGAVKMHLDLKYQTDSMFAQIQISSGDVANTDTWNAGEYKYTKHTSIVETTLDIEGTDTVTINFYNQAMVENTSYWGYWIDVTGYDADGNQITGGGANTTQYKPTEMPAAILSISGEGGSGITPSGELEIIENGSYDVTEYASAQVSVPVGVFPEGTLEITANGEHTVTTYEKVNVNVASSGSSGDTEVEDALLKGTLAGAYTNDRITSLRASAFYQCKQLTSVDFPNLTSGVDTNTFYYCSALKSVNLPLMQSIIGMNVFYNCTSLEEITLPSVTTIGQYNSGIFSYCYALKKVSLPQLSGSWIPNTMFSYCNNLETVILGGSEMNTLNTATSPFTGATKMKDGTGFVYVPAALIETYQADSKWASSGVQFRAIEDYPDICG